MEEAKVRALMELADIPVLSLHRIENKYWPNNGHYEEIRRESPWWLVRTPFGLIEIGWRKRVISIDWENTDLRGQVTDDDVTKSETMVHAWSYVKALTYLTELNKLAARAAIAAQKEGE